LKSLPTKGIEMAETKKKPAAKKPAAKKPAAKKPAAKKAAPKKAPAKKAAKKVVKKAAAGKPNKISAEERYRMVEVAAYFLAERNKFAGSPIGYWTAAEAQIKKMLS
jgi:hypothetical protein